MRPRLRESLTEIVLGVIAFATILVGGAYFATSTTPAVGEPVPAATVTVARDVPIIRDEIVRILVTPTPRATPKPRLTPAHKRPVRVSRSITMVRLCILARESHGNYHAVSKETYRGMHAYGGYQFQDPTWWRVTHLRGHASDYPPSVQDAAFIKLYAGGKGRSNWYWRGHAQCW